MFQSSYIVAKVGGSLFSWPCLKARLRILLASLECSPGRGTRVIFFPGGGAAADAIRDLDRVHALGQELAHWLALRALTTNAFVLHALLPEAPVVSLPTLSTLVGEHQGPDLPDIAILDPFPFAVADEHHLDHLPHTWEVTSDSLAARAAHLIGAHELILLKSITMHEGMAWPVAAAKGYVDGYFPKLMQQIPGLKVRLVNLRAWPLDAWGKE
jgi:5-(aminomethyl)-3-furanmethanol phosphate kinase